MLILAHHSARDCHWAPHGDIEKFMTIYKKLTLFVISVLILSCPLPQSGESTSLFSTMFADTHNYWTIMYYVDGDNNLEQALLDDMEELSKGLAGTEMITVIALIDRIEGYSSDTTILGTDFTDTRLFRIGSDTFYSLSGEEFLPGIEQGTGEEYNMGDAQTLKKFIEYCKKYFPADNYGLIFSNHGSGVRSYSGTDTTDFTKGGSGLSDGSLTLLDKSIAYDVTSLRDSIYTAELTDVLDDSHSVDLLVYDACLMGLLEIAYQYRPGVAGEFSADYMVASAPNVWYYGFPYDRIFSRIFHFTQDTGLDSTVTGTSQSMFRYAPADLTPERLGRIFVEEQKLDTGGGNAQVLALYDLSKAEPVTIALNAVAADLGDIVLNVDGESNLDSIRSNILSYISVTDPDPIGAPHYDLYEFAQDTTGSVGVGKRDSLKMPWMIWSLPHLGTW
jgi:clostripain